jgi:hypothetical protein
VPGAVQGHNHCQPAADRDGTVSPFARSASLLARSPARLGVAGGLFGLGALLALAGCAGPLARAEAQFADGQYPAAKQALAALESESRSWDAASRAEYALYRGLTLAALGDSSRGAAWLGDAKVAEDARPGSLSPEDARRLAAALQAGGF